MNVLLLPQAVGNSASASDLSPVLCVMVNIAIAIQPAISPCYEKISSTGLVLDLLMLGK